MPYVINEICNGCSACALQCPTRAISGEFKVRYDVEPRLCIDCGVCGAVCPLPAVLDHNGQPAPRILRNQRLRPLIDVDLCNGCGLCVDFCPFDCLDIVGPRFLGVATLAEAHGCVSCRECEVICIKGAIEMGRFDLRAYDPRENAAKVAVYIGAEPEPAATAGETVS